MRTLVTKYANNCRKCGTHHPIGSTVVYEKRVGIFCPACAPTDTEEIRAVRQEAANRKADRFDDWAEKRETKAHAALNSYPTIRHDWAFITQPGRIPFRDRMNRADERAIESLDVAERMRTKAASLRHVQVKGDAERKREAEREKTRAWIQKGMRVHSPIFDVGTVTRINKKTATVCFDRGCTYPQDLSWLRPA